MGLRHEGKPLALSSGGGSGSIGRMFRATTLGSRLRVRRPRSIGQNILIFDCFSSLFARVQFLRAFSGALKDSLKSVGSDLTDYIELDGTSLHDEIALVLSDMANAKQRVLFVMDGFDHVLARTAISRNTWDTLRSFAQRSSLRLVTGSRLTLRELCKTEDSATSDLWEMFNPNPLRVGRLEDHDWDGFLGPFKKRSIVIDSSGLKEIVNWTGGIPQLAASLLQLAYETYPDGSTLTKTEIDEMGAKVMEERRDLIADIWDDCSTEIQGDLVDLQVREIPLLEIQDERRRDLELRGLVRTVGNSLRSGCTLIGNCAKFQTSGVESMRRLFGDAERFSRNIRGLLELRMRQVQSMDRELYELVTRAIRDLGAPTYAVGGARLIANRAFDLIWRKEGIEKEIPISWVSNLKEFAKDRRIPSGGRACRLLQIATGTDDVPRLTKCVSKRTYALVNFLHSVGDHGQHLGSEEVTLSYAVSFCFAALELCESLADDFARESQAVHPESS